MPKLGHPKILLVEDAPDVRLIIQATLSDSDLTIAQTLAEGMIQVEKNAFDLYILDIGLPDGESFELCTSIRQNPATAERPILFLSGRSSEIDKLKAFSQGADDYMTKPFSALEFKARVQAKLRGLFKKVAPQVFSYPPLRVDVDRRKVLIAENGVERPIRLTKIEFNLLLCLMKRPEVIKTRAALLNEVWGDAISITERSVDVHIYNLRKKLGSCADMIGADHGNGYFFVPRTDLAKSS